ncbi:MAG TPA: (d)CMP kinase [Xanthobacteraceae bacterium]|nr:(d)CMP kinase [Xanthobacteraceae bacterium]
MIIAIDGPAASGKGTLGRRLAAHYQFHHLDTGLIYRAVAKALLDAGSPLDSEAAAAEVARALTAAQLDDPILKTDPIGQAASKISVFPAVRSALLDFQRSFARQQPGAVLDGRDIGTVICPDAEVKIFVVADPEVRARRRFEELIARGEAADEALVLADIKARDTRDRNRELAPLKPAPDAHSLDTTALDIDAAVAAAIAIVEHRQR